MGQLELHVCPLKTYLNFYSFVTQQTDQEIKTVHLNRGAHIEVLIKTHRDRALVRKSLTQNKNVDIFPRYFPQAGMLKAFFTHC